jgi:hypothetical protein
MWNLMLQSLVCVPFVFVALLKSCALGSFLVWVESVGYWVSWLGEFVQVYGVIPMVILGSSCVILE